jgi:nucleotide-binding universal stress UspA family protein
MRILLASDGSFAAHRAALYVKQVALATHAEVVLLGVAEKPQAEADLRERLVNLRQELEGWEGCAVSVKVRHGKPDQEILSEAEEHFYHLIVIGSQGVKPLQRMLQRTARRLIRVASGPLLIVVGQHESISQVLICTSGEKPGEVDTLVGGALAALLGASVTVLHVMSQIALVRDAQIDDLERGARALVESGSREGRHLQRLRSILTAQNILPDQVRLKIRHGLVVDEILNELHEGNYDLIVVGAHQVPADQAWPQFRALLQEDIVEEIVSRTPCPVLIVRARDYSGWPNRPAQSPPQDASER